MQLKRIYYINGTHWDREWYKTFQGFRYLLMDVMDEVIETLENTPDFPMYMLDGQTAVLDDYLEISPQMRDRLEKLIQDGRIAVGPWYTMPDEFIPSGESLIRNLLMGHAKAKEYGAEKAMSYGYVCDIFGHIAQFPQILNGFGIRGALMQRGGNMDTWPPHFRWTSPDGSQVLGYRTPEDFGYGAFYHYATEPYNQGWDTDLDHLLERAIKEIDREIEELNQPYLVLHDALDHQHITKPAPWLARKLAEHYGCEVVFKTLDDMVDSLWEKRENLPEMKGELALTAHLDRGTNILLTYVVSSRYDLKKANDDAQNLWEKWAEPLSAMAAVQGRAIRPRYRDVAYLELIRNHAHDSICGCAVEEVHRDMHYRFRQTEMIGKEVIEDVLRQDVRKVVIGENPEQMIVRVFNPLPYENKQTIKVDIHFPEEFSARFSEGEREYEWKNSFMIYDRDGNEVPYTLCGIKRGSFVKSPTLYKADVYTVCINAELLPMGYTEYKVCPAPKPLRVRYIQGQSCGYMAAENTYLRVQITPQGTVNITDKRTGRIYSDLIRYQDGADIGDGWMHIRPSSDSWFFGNGIVQSIERLYDGPTETAFRITSILNLPRGVDFKEGHMARSADMTEVKIVTTIRLGAWNDHVDVHTEVYNTAMDHRLQVCFPTDVLTDTYQAGQAFTVLTRPVGQDDGTGKWKEPQFGDRNFNGVAFKRDATGGLAFMAKSGIHEINALNDDRGTLAVTLYRSFPQTVGNDNYSQIDGELLQTLSFDYTLMPLTPDTCEGDIIRCRDHKQAGTQLYTMYVAPEYALGQDISFLRLAGDNLAVSIIKRPEDLEENCVVVRIYNCSDETSRGVLTAGYPVKEAWITNLLEQPETQCSTKDHQVSLTLGARKIQTLRIKLDINK